MKEIKLYINGEFKNSSDGKTIDSINPATGEVYAKCAVPSNGDIDYAVESAHKAFYSSEWKSFDQNKRSDLLLAISEKLKERKKDFIEAEIADSGAVAKKAIADLHNSASFFKVMSKVAKTFNFEEKDESASREGFSFNYRSYNPIGVCAQIIPWNFPLVMAAWKIGPILATGCTTVLKTAKETPASAMLLAEVLNDVGLPKGVVNIITGGREVVKTLVTHPKISKVAFTGSTEVGKEILKLCSPTIKNCTLELGGKSPNIILDDADLDIAVDGALYAFLYHQGQACTSGTRLLVQDGIYDEFIKRFLNRISQVKIGKTDDMAVGYGPMINENQFKNVMNYIDITKKEGARLLFGGQRITGGDLDKGYYIAPTAFEITPDNTIFHEEIFGPVVGITRFKNIEEAINLANNSIYGLAGAVWSKDVEKAKDLARRIETGTVWINEYHLLNPGMPFGGYKQSGLGREMGKEGILGYLEVKHLWISDCNQREKKPWFDHLF
jgi:acyl-CoA reductase-like NAD-dependent aldehyde dehydrogenase